MSISTNYHSGVVLYMIFHRNIIISCFLHFCEIFFVVFNKMDDHQRAHVGGDEGMGGSKVIVERVL